MNNPILQSESFDKAAYSLGHSLNTFTDAVQSFRRSVDRLATILGMQAENDQRKAIGASMAYTESDFEAV